jgi:hypothetical protein
MDASHWPPGVPHIDSPAARHFSWSDVPRIIMGERAKAVASAIFEAPRHVPAAVLQTTGQELGATSAASCRAC